MRRAKLEGRRIGRAPLDFDRHAVLRDRGRGMSLTDIARLTVSPVPASAGSSKRPPKPLARKGAFQHPSKSMKTGCRIRQPEVAQKEWV